MENRNLTSPGGGDWLEGRVRGIGGVGEEGDEDGEGVVFNRKQHCTDYIPTTRELLAMLPTEGHVLAAVLSLFTILTLAIYIEEIHFIRKRKFNKSLQTIWVLACYPMFSLTGLLGVLVPKSGALIDLMANAFFATCLYNFGELVVGYIGGRRRMWGVIGKDRYLAVNIPPLGCCCCCIQPVQFKRTVFNRIQIIVLQVAVVRPLLMFLAVALWANGSYHPGTFAVYNAFGYFAVLNVISTVTAVYGLMLYRNVFEPELGLRYLITGKIASVQLSLIISGVMNFIIGLLVNSDVIKCGPFFPSKARGEAIYHGCLVLLMLPMSLLAQRFFRRSSDAFPCTSGPDGDQGRPGAVEESLEGYTIVEQNDPIKPIIIRPPFPPLPSASTPKGAGDTPSLASQAGVSTAPDVTLINAQIWQVMNETKV